MARRAKAMVTLDDLYRLPDRNLKYGLSCGRLVSEPPPGVRHGRVAANLVYALKSYVRKHGGGIVLTCDSWFVLARGPDTVRGPDVAYVTLERLETLVDDRKPFPGPPDLAVEVLSPSDREASVHSKLNDYLGNQTPLVWIVDPEAQKFLVCSSADTMVLGTGDTLTAPSLLPGFSLPVKDVFA